MSTDVSWVIIRDRMPFTVGDELGVVKAPDKATAIQRGTALFGAPVVARSAMSKEAEKFEPHKSLTPKPKRKYGHGHGRPKGSKNAKPGAVRAAHERRMANISAASADQ